MENSSVVPSKRDALRVATMIDSRLIWFEHYVPWAESLIERLEVSPIWLLDLVTTKYQPDAFRIVLRYTQEPPFQEFNESRQLGEHIACLYLRYERREISWATFLQEAGTKLDGAPGAIACEEVFGLLTEFRHSEFSRGVESAQHKALLAVIQSDIDAIRPLYEVFLESFRRFLASHGRVTDS